jgi:CHAT domain-containing protein
MNMKTNSLIALFLTSISFFAHANENQKAEFKKSEQAIKAVYNEVFPLLNEKGQAVLKKDQEEWLKKRKSFISSYAQYSAEKANQLIIEVNWKRVKELKDFQSQLQEQAKKENSNKLPPEIEKKLDEVMQIIVAGDKLANEFKNKEALEQFTKALGLAKGYFGDSNVVVSKIHSKMAISYGFLGDKQQAIESFLKAIELSDKSLGPDHPDSAEIMESLAATYNSIAHRGKAMSILQRAKEIKEKNFGKTDPRLASTLRDIAYTVFATGDYNSSYLYAEQADKLVQPVRESNPSLVSSIKVLMGVILSQLGFYDMALQAYQEAIQLNAKTSDQNASFYDGSFSGIAQVYESQGNFGEALGIYKKILDFQHGNLGRDSAASANTQRAIATLHFKMGEHQKAIDLLLPLVSSNFSNDQTGRVLTLNNLGMAYEGNSDFESAIKYLDQSLELGREINGPTHPITIQTLANIASLSAKMGNESRARSTAMQWVAALEDRRESVFNLSEGERLLWVNQNFNFGIPVTCLKPNQIADIILRWKGVVLDSILEDRAIYRRISTSEGGPKLVEDIQSKKNQVAALLAEKNYDRKKFEELQRSVELMETSIANQAMSDGRARIFSLVSHDQIVDCIPKSAAVIDFVSYFDPIKKENAYAASIIDAQGNIQIAIIDDAAKVNDLVTEYRKNILTRDNKLLSSTLRSLHEKVWKPIQSKLSNDTKIVFLGAEGMLNFVSFATLLDEKNEFLCNTFDFRYIGSGRDLLKKTDQPKPKKIAIYADPDFSSEIVLTKSFGMRTLDLGKAEMQLDPLPGSRQEAQVVSEVASNAGLSSEIQMGEEASEQNLAKIQAPSILHLATHGFFVGFSDDTKSASRGMKPVSTTQTPPTIFNPMRQGAITLAGAQNTLRKWDTGSYPDPSNDGILTAEEVAGINLAGTWLVVLSSCDSGKGMIQAGEGVFGLRRGFLIAGARNLLMTLWPVSDKFGPYFMEDFYKEVLVTNNPAESLAKVQREWLNKLHKERDLASAVGLAGPFVMAVTGSNH